MFKKIGLIAAFLFLSNSAFAACTNPLAIKDATAATINMSVSTNADGFCQYNFNMAQINGVVPLMGNGATGTGSARMTIANDNTIPTGWPTAANQTSQITQETAINTVLGLQADAVCGTATGTCTLQALIKFLNNAAIAAIPAGTNLIGDVNLRQGGTALSATNGVFSNILQGNAVLSATKGIFTNVLQGDAVLTAANPLPTSNASSTTGGATAYPPFVPTASDNHQTVKNGAGTAYWMAVSNNSATKNYARLYDLGTGFNGCNSATGILFAFEIPPTDSGFTIQLGGVNGLAFSTGLSLCITSGFGLTDTTNATATAMYVNVGYK